MITRDVPRGVQGLESRIQPDTGASIIGMVDVAAADRACFLAVLEGPRNVAQCSAIYAFTAGEALR